MSTKTFLFISFHLKKRFCLFQGLIFFIVPVVAFLNFIYTYNYYQLCKNNKAYIYIYYAVFYPENNSDNILHNTGFYYDLVCLMFGHLVSLNAQNNFNFSSISYFYYAKLLHALPEYFQSSQ